MKAKCIVNNLFAVENACALNYLSKYIGTTDGEVDIEIGKTYTVYGIEFWDNHPWFYLCTEEHTEYPTPYASIFFEIVDERLSPHWQLKTQHIENNIFQTCLVVKEWAETPLYYELLIDGDEKIVESFSRIRAMLDKE